MLKWLKALISKNDWDHGNDMQRLAARGGLDRRKNARIRYPENGPVGSLPHAFLNSNPVPVYDVSLGGLCLSDEGDLVPDPIGSEITLVLKWRDGYSSPVECKVVGASSGKRHIQFSNLPSEAFLRLNVELRAGHLGRRLRLRATHEKQSSIQMGAKEIWSGVTGESLVFFPGPTLYAELKLFNNVFELNQDQPPIYRDSGKGQVRGQRVPPELLADIILFLANVERPSALMKELIESLHKIYQEDLGVAS